jgi:hypothetical protein
MPVVGTIQGADVKVERSIAGAVRTQRATLERSLALAVAAGGDVELHEAACGPLAAGGSVQIRRGGCGPVVAGGDVSISEGGAGPVAAAGNVTLRRAFVPVLLAGGEVTSEEGSRVGVSVRAPAPALAVASLVGLVVGALLGRRRR